MKNTKESFYCLVIWMLDHSSFEGRTWDPTYPEAKTQIVDRMVDELLSELAGQTGVSWLPIPEKLNLLREGSSIRKNALLDELYDSAIKDLVEGELSRDNRGPVVLTELYERCHQWYRWVEK